MPFPFTFNLAVPGLSNPFSTPQTPQNFMNPLISNGPISRAGMLGKSAARRPSPISTHPSIAPISRKRGWEPTFAEPSRSTATLASTRGRLDGTGNFTNMNDTPNEEVHDDGASASAEDMPPPAKRRRGLAGTIVSTALNAALIGTAVGLTVYRLWRDRGKEPERLPPPPPYQQGGWVPATHSQHPQLIKPSPAIKPAPITPRSRRTRHTTSSTIKRPGAHRRPRIHPQTFTPPPRSTSPAPFPPAQPEFNFGHEEEEVVDTQMDWIGDKLSTLIEEGKKALGREIVVMSDAKEDEIDDGSDVWEEEAQTAGPSSISRSSSMKRVKRPRNIPLPPSLSSSRTPSSSPWKSAFDLTSTTSPLVTPRRAHSRGPSIESSQNLIASPTFKEDERCWESPEMKESMEKARARFLRNRGT